MAFMPKVFRLLSLCIQKKKKLLKTLGMSPMLLLTTFSLILKVDVAYIDSVLVLYCRYFG